jgi:hypothetical protein
VIRLLVLAVAGGLTAACAAGGGSPSPTVTTTERTTLTATPTVTETVTATPARMPSNDAELKQCADQRYEFWVNLGGQGASRAEKKRQYEIARGVCRVNGFL